MHIWCLDKWKSNIPPQIPRYKTGLRMHCEQGINEVVRFELLQFARWLRKEYVFPLRVNVYVKKARRIKAMDGDNVVGTCWRPSTYMDFPYIRLATGDYDELVEKWGEEEAIWAILATFAHELTHYFQHINGIQLTSRGEERQATAYARYVLSEYVDSIRIEGGRPGDVPMSSDG